MTTGKSKIKGIICMLLATIIWGSAFVAQSEAKIPPITFTAMRSAIGTVFLVGLVLVFDVSAKKKGTYKKMTKDEKMYLLKAGTVCGLCLTGGMLFQQIGISLGTEPGKAGFITAMYILIVPVIAVFFGKKVSAVTWVSLFIALSGLFLLCINVTDESFSFASLFRRSDLLVMLCALVYSLHITSIDIFAPKVDGVKLSCVQFAVCTVILSVLAVIFEEPNLSQAKDSWFELLYAGIGSSGIAFTLQIIAQKHLSPVMATLFMSFESVFALLSEMFVYMTLPAFLTAVNFDIPEFLMNSEYSRPTYLNFAGCCIIFIAIMLAQVPSKNEK